MLTELQWTHTHTSFANYCVCMCLPVSPDKWVKQKVKLEESMPVVLLRNKQASEHTDWQTDREEGAYKLLSSLVTTVANGANGPQRGDDRGWKWEKKKETVSLLAGSANDEKLVLFAVWANLHSRRNFFLSFLFLCVHVKYCWFWCVGIYFFLALCLCLSAKLGA